MRWLVLAAAVISLSGCGLPPALTYASYAADAFSYLATGKSVTDHGISMALEKDCALLRVLDGPICIEEVEEVGLSDCARSETSHDTAGTRDGSGKGDAFMRRPSEDGLHATPQGLETEMVCPTVPEAITAQRPDMTASDALASVNLRRRD